MTTGIYLEDNPPIINQYRVARRAPARPVGLVHTTESARKWAALQAAEFIANRAGHGSYHLVGDEHRSIIQLVRFENEAFHDGTGSNRWSCGIALCMDAAEWSHPMDLDRRAGLIDTAATMAAMVGHWHIARGRKPPAAAHITKEQSDSRTGTGWLAHGDRDPTRRSDPGPDFPWNEFLHQYLAKMKETPATMPPNPQHRRQTHLEQYQQHLLDAGYDIGAPSPDGAFGPAMLATSLKLFERAHTVQPPAPVDPMLAAKAAKWDRHVQAARDVLDEAGR